MKWAANIVALALEHITQVETLERLRQQIADERDRARGALLRPRRTRQGAHRAAPHGPPARGRAARRRRTARSRSPRCCRRRSSSRTITEASVRYGDIDRTDARASPRRRGRSPAGFETRDGTRGALEVVYLARAAGRRPKARSCAKNGTCMNSLADMVSSALDKRAADAARARRRGAPAQRARPRAAAARDHHRRGLGARPAPAAGGGLAAPRARRFRTTSPASGCGKKRSSGCGGTRWCLGAEHSLLEEGRLVSIGSPADVDVPPRRNHGLQLGRHPEARRAVGVGDGGGRAALRVLRAAQDGARRLRRAQPRQARRRRRSRPDEVELLEEVGQQLAIAFENALSFRAAERYRQESLAQRDRLRLLLDVNNQLLAQHESHATRLSVLARARRVRRATTTPALVIFDAEANELRVEAHTYYDERGVIEPRRRAAARALALGRGVLRAAHPDVHRGRVRPVRPGAWWRA